MFRLERLHIIILTILSALVFTSMPAFTLDWDVKSDTWVATDSIGRSLPGYAECGPPREGKFVGIFYLLWHSAGYPGPYDITQILAANPDDPQWGYRTWFHHWGQSENGYYLSKDPYVIRKHARELVDAGVDVVVLDETNILNEYTDPYTEAYTQLCTVFQQIRNEGGRTPQICFFCPWAFNGAVKRLYTDFYSKNLYSDLWFYWDGKPLILAGRDNPLSAQNPAQLDQNIKDFFTFRHAWPYASGGAWSFMEYYPQPAYYQAGVPEQIAVSVAQQYPEHIGAMSDPAAHGRSYHDGSEPPPEARDYAGHNFAEQWERALAVDPKFVFINEWNEWIAQRFISDGTDGRAEGSSIFYDQYTQEFSRDVEPMKGGHTDNYYYQMIENIRRYKGVRAPEAASPSKTITIDGGFSDWADVGPEFRDHIADTTPRNHAGWGYGALTYVNTTGRNDFVRLKVANDAENVYFYAETANNITSYTGARWMMLFIDSDCNPSTGWQGYDYVVNYPPVNSTTTTVKHSAGGWNWTHVANVPYRAGGNKMEIAVPRSAIGQDGDPGTALDFHWADNIQKTDDIIEFAVSGDSAPGRRFNYRYMTVPDPAMSFIATGGDTANHLSWNNPADKSFAGVVIRYRTDRYPDSPTDGILVCDKTNTPGSDDFYVHKGLTNRTYYYSAFTYNKSLNHGDASNTAASPTVNACFVDDFSYPDGPLNGRGGWSGSATSQIDVTGQTVRIWGGASSYDAVRSISCTDGGTGLQWVHVKVKSGLGGVTSWSLWIDDASGKNLARWYGAGTTARGRIGAGSQVTPVQSLSGGWDDLHILLRFGGNTSEFYFNGSHIGTLSHAETGAGDAIGRIRFERVHNSVADGSFLYFDDLQVGSPDTTITGIVDLQDYAGSVAGMPIDVVLRRHGGGTTNVTVYLDSSGRFTITGVSPGTYDVVLKAGHWLQKVIPNVVLGP